jgi:hypothetical protein
VAVGVLAVSVTATAQPLPEDKLAGEREVVVTGEPGERPAVVFAAANVGVQLVFDAPLQRTDGGIALRLPGGDVRLHPYLENALVLTPSKALASGPMVPLQVHLVDGGVPLLLTFQPGRVDHVLRILQRPLPHDAGTVVPRDAFEETLSTTSGAVFKDGACAPLRSSRAQARNVDQRSSRNTTGAAALVCAAGTVNYLRVPRTTPGCAVTSARLLHQRADAEVLLLEPAHSEKEGTWQVLATWSPPEDTSGFVLLLLAADGTVCEQHKVTLGPGGSP